MNNLWQGPVPEQSDARETVPGRSAAAQEPSRTLRRQGTFTPGCLLTCEVCGGEFQRGKAGVVPRFCSDKCRKRSYGGTCVECGAATNGHDGIGQAPDHCSPCANKARRIWTRETVIAAIQDFAKRYGRAPVATDFNPSHARLIGHADAALKEQRFREGGYPRQWTVHEVFGGWNVAIAAAGFEPRGPGDRLSDERKVAA